MSSTEHPNIFKDGLQVRRDVVGNAYVDAALQNGSSEFAYPSQQLVTEQVVPTSEEISWTDLSGGAGATFGAAQVLRKNSAAYIGMLIALKSWPELSVHVRGAVNNGLTEVEIREAVLQATVYCGVPAGVEAMKVAEKTITDMVAKGEHKRQLAEASPLLQS